MFVATFDIITFLISSIWLIKSLKNIAKGSRYFINALIYVFYVLPLGMDYFIEMADYSYSGFLGFIAPRQDVLTVIFYDLGMLYTQYMILFHRVKKSDTLYQNNVNESNYTPWVVLGMIIPAVAVLLLLRQPGMLYMFQWRELELFPADGSYATIEKFTYLGVSCSVFLLFDLNKKWYHPLRLIALAFLMVNICIQGKRAIMFFAMINVAVLVYLRFNELVAKNKHIFVFIVFGLALLVIAVYSMVFMTVTVKMDRGYNVDDTSVMYTTTRIDFLRDDRVRLAIYSELHKDEVEILDYPLQTYAGDIFGFIPLNYIPSLVGMKIYSYQTYFTYAVIHKKRSGNLDVANNSFMTVSCFAELISNLGLLLGMALMPFICLWFARRIDKYPYPFNAFIICSFILLHLFDVMYIAIYLELTFFLCLIYKNKRKQPYIKNSLIKKLINENETI